MQKIVQTIIFLLFIVFPGMHLQAQKVYFADGYHGGIYGHYPLWQTQFMVDTLKKYRDWQINLEIEPETWDTVQLKNPVAYKNFQSLFTDSSTAGRIEFVNPGYAQSYLYTASGESMIRQFAYGMKKIQQHFPQATFITYSSEEPCFTSALPQVLKLFGFKYAVLKNPNTCWGGYVKNHGEEIINWIGPDGTSIATVPRYSTELLEPNSTWQTTGWQNSREYINSALNAGIRHPVGMCLQDAGWKNGRWLGNNRSKSIYTTWRNYFEQIADTTHAEDWHLSQQDIKVSLVWGAQVLQKIAQQVRIAENKLLHAEKIAAIGSIVDKTPWDQNLFDSAWRTLLLSQHHDCWIVPYNGKKGDTWADKVHNWTSSTNILANEIIERSAQSSTKNNSSAVTVYNTMLGPRSELAEMAVPGNIRTDTELVINDHGKRYPVQLLSSTNDKRQMVFPVTVNGFGRKTLTLETGSQSIQDPAKITVNGDEYIMQTDLYRLTINTAFGGAITSLRMKKANNLELIEQASKTKCNTLQGNFFKAGGFHFSAMNKATAQILENGPLLVRLAIKNNIAGHAYTQIITLKQTEPGIDLEISIDWNNDPRIGEDYRQDNGYQSTDLHKAFYNDTAKLVITFPFQLSKPQVTVDAPFDVTTSTLDNTFYNTWDSIKNNVILNWIDVSAQDNSHGVTLFTDHTTSYSKGAHYPLALTLQYAGVGLWGRDYKAENITHVRYALLPHTSSWKEANIYTASEQWQQPLVTRDISLSDIELLRAPNAKWILTSAIRQDRYFFFRLFNAEGDADEHTLYIGRPVKQACIVDLKGNVMKTLHVSGRNMLKLALKEKQIVTVRLLFDE